jgi:septal ring factor EnvC (AmiA/AmiB activator)
MEILNTKDGIITQILNSQLKRTKSSLLELEKTEKEIIQRLEEIQSSIKYFQTEISAIKSTLRDLDLKIEL